MTSSPMVLMSMIQELILEGLSSWKELEIWHPNLKSLVTLSISKFWPWIVLGLLFGPANGPWNGVNVVLYAQFSLWQSLQLLSWQILPSVEPLSLPLSHLEGLMNVNEATVSLPQSPNVGSLCATASHWPCRFLINKEKQNEALNPTYNLAMDTEFLISPKLEHEKLYCKPSNTFPVVPEPVSHEYCLLGALENLAWISSGNLQAYPKLNRSAHHTPNIWHK